MSHPPSSSSQQPQFAHHSLPDGSHIQLIILEHPDSLKPAVACDLCGKPIEITATGSLAYFTQHRGSKSCKKKERARQNAVVISESRTILQTMVFLWFQVKVILYFKHFCYFKVPSHNAGLLIPPSSHSPDDYNSESMLPATPATPPTMPTSQVSDNAILPSTPSPVDGSPLQSSKHAQLSPSASSPGHMPSTDEDYLSDLAMSMADLRSSSESPSPTPRIDSMQECTGVLVEWTAGSVWDTYPYHQHGIRSHPWEPIGFEGNDSWLRLRSKDCCIVLLHKEMNRLCCRKCAAIPSSSEFRKFVGRATNAAEHTPYFFLTQRQLHSLLVKVTTKYRELALKVCFFF